MAVTSRVACMSEQDMRRRVIKMLTVLDAVAVENPACPGTPDVNFIGGWVELKWLRAWPKGAATPVRVEHFTPQQKLWLRRRRRRGGAAWLLLQCRKEWLLLQGEVAADCLGKATREQLLLAAHRVWANGINKMELLECLQTKNY